ncbi:DUF3995 domain-containing protein [Dyadobacter sp. BHUBP1]|uniref:DUF3995 domain-containing protein n=1 Tax=Dyadobacter sp. BHUBP1 TaxID=3424178 RepID=UPI003D325843
MALNTIIFLSLSLLHVYWAAGGKWAATQVLPQTAGGSKVFVPRAGMTLVVAAGLLFFSALNAVNLYNDRSQPGFRYGLLAVGLIFLVRVVGDFRYIGVTKSVRDTTFARNDNRIFIPLCLYLVLTSLLTYFIG